MSRRDVFLRTGIHWEVEAREGGPEGKSRTWRFDTEAEARDFLRRCLTGPGDWRQLTAERGPADT
jgi:hypothetical protein